MISEVDDKRKERRNKCEGMLNVSEGLRFTGRLFYDRKKEGKGGKKKRKKEEIK